MLKDMVEFQKEVVLWGSDAVIKEYLSFKHELSIFSIKRGDFTSEATTNELAPVFLSAGRLLTAMRRAIGYTFTSFSAVELSRLQLLPDVVEEMASSLEGIGKGQ